MRIFTSLFFAIIVSILNVFAQQSDEWIDQALEQKNIVLKKYAANGLPFESKVYKKGDKPGHVEINLQGLDHLALITWATFDGNNHDHAVWADAKFIANDGTETWLSDVNFASKEIAGNWFSLKKNLEGGVISIADKVYNDGVVEHPNGSILIDLKGKNWVKFISDIGIENSGSRFSSVVFKIQTDLPKDEVEYLRDNCKEIETDFLPYLPCNLEMWLTTPSVSMERAAVENIIHQFSKIDKSKFNIEFEKIEKLPTDKEKIKAYIALFIRIKENYDLLNNIGWLNPDAVRKAYADFCKTNGYDTKKWQPVMDEFNEIVKNNLLSLDNTTLAERALDLKRQILFSNPAVCNDIIVTRYKLGESRSRSEWTSALGTQPSNYSCQLSAARSGFNAELLQISDIKSKNPTKRLIYKACNTEPITDVTLHWNADRIMFTSCDSLRRFQIYEVNIDGTGHHQVSQVEDQDLEFFDAQYLPSGKIVTCSNIGYNGVPCVDGADYVGNYSLYDPKTHELRRLTFDQDNDWNATVLKNGKVMYTRWEYTDLTHYYSRIVFTMNPDGTEQRALYGSGSMFPNSTFDMQQLPENSNRFIGIITGHHGIARSGRLIIFDPTKNRAGAEGMVTEIPYSSRPIETKIEDQLVFGDWPQFAKPHPLSDKYFLVTAKLSPVSPWGIYLVDIYDNVVPVVEDIGYGYINPIALVKKNIPVNIPERVPMDLTNADKEATVFIQDLYEGEGLKGVPRGTVKQLRIFAYEYAYLHSPSNHLCQGIQSGWDIKRLLGYVPVETDGSAIFKIPANTPISIQPVDSMGRAIQWMRSWTIGMPGETVSCIGCHENQNQIAMPKRTQASTIKPHELSLPFKGPRAINFEQDIQPILNRACVGCHNGEKHAAGIDYTGGRMDSLSASIFYSKSYLQFHPYFYRQGPESEMAVLNPYEFSAYNSDMTQMLLAGHHGVKLTDEDMRTIYTWLDMNMPYHNSLVSTPHMIPGGATVDQKERRLEISKKYSCNTINWEKEISDYQSYLDSLPSIEARTPQPTSVIKERKIRVRGFPFSEEVARVMQGKNETRLVELSPGITIEFVKIPAGSYIMGNDKAMSAPKKKITIKKAFWMSTTELSNAQVRAILPNHDSRYIGQHWKDHTTAGYPVNADTLAATKMSFDECMEFCRIMSDKTGLNVNIPTEEQWEWAARAGSNEDFWYGNIGCDYSEYDNMGDWNLSLMAVSGIDPKPMDQNTPLFRFCGYIPRDEKVNDHHMLMTSSKNYKSNPWGLYDMNGNVAEWTRTVFYPDPSNTGTIEYIVKGGSWYDRAKRSTCSSRRSYLPWIKVWNAGIRLVID